jgi:hypothetical protein
MARMKCVASASRARLCGPAVSVGGSWVRGGAGFRAGSTSRRRVPTGEGGACVSCVRVSR